MPDVRRRPAPCRAEEHQVAGLAAARPPARSMPPWNCSPTVRGTSMPCCANTYQTKPLQSKPDGIAAAVADERRTPLRQRQRRAARPASPAALPPRRDAAIRRRRGTSGSTERPRRARAAAALGPWPSRAARRREVARDAAPADGAAGGREPSRGASNHGHRRVHMAVSCAVDRPACARATASAARVRRL